ncbi:MAG: ribonuclease H-like domain-containing protein [Candidatus Sumerlaeota bacterium]|nr:ribonuclease H-like domain-containing protein [Candidatus Sumerlaeota bacterium]
MSLTNKLDVLAGERAARRRAEVERLLAENPGRLLRTGNIAAASVPHRATTEAPRGEGLAPARPIHELIVNCQRMDGESPGVLRTVSAVSAAPHPEGPPHPRGYSFAPAPSRPLPSPDNWSRMLAALAADEAMGGTPIESLAFLDAETTGLYGAPGIVAFLIGVGYFRRGNESGGGGLEFVCEQYFMEDYCAEPRMLETLEQRLRGFAAFVTYNGKNFDLPLLRARFVMNRMRANLERPHLDLLWPSRRAYRARIGSCSLANIENVVLGLRRQHDIPGSLIPQIYFDYVHTRRAAGLVPVFDHNAQDVITMGALLLHMTECALDPAHHRLADARDMAGYGRLLRSRGMLDMAAAHYERAASAARDAAAANSSLCELAAVYRKLGRHADAADIWRAECRRDRRGGLDNPMACIELAKLLEHQLRDYEAALEHIANIEKLASFSAPPRLTNERAALLDDLAARKRRILRKIERAARKNP